MKIGLTGTVSVGKTTLVKELAKLSEFKDYTIACERSKYLNSLGIPLNHQTTIEGQTIFLAERVTELMQDNIITDRTVIDVMAFTQCAKKISVINADSFIEYAKRFIYQYNYIFYVSPEGVEIENNGVRETDSDYRNEIDKTIQELLFRHVPKYHIIKGSTEDRIKQVMEIINF